MELREPIPNNNRATSKEIMRRIKDKEVRFLMIYFGPRVDSDPAASITEHSEMKKLGRYIGANTRLDSLDLCWDHHEDEIESGIQLLCEGINRNRNIRSLHLKQFDDDSWSKFQLDPFLEHNIRLSYIYCEFSGNATMSLLLAPLMRRQRPVHHLSIDGDYNAEVIVRQLCANVALAFRMFSFRRFLSNPQNGYNSIATLLQDPRCTLETLDLQSNEINTESAVMLLNALVENTTLKELQFSHNFFENRNDFTGLRALLHTLCDRRSINATYNSNHTLECFTYLRYLRIENLGYQDEFLNDNLENEDMFNLLFSNVKQCLEWNENDNKKEVARRKVFMQHFIHGFRMAPFEKMKPEFLMRSLNFMAKASAENDGVTNDTARRSIIYALIKNNPMVCDFMNHSSSVDALKRRSMRIRRNTLKRKCMGW